MMKAPESNLGAGPIWSCWVPEETIREKVGANNAVMRRYMSVSSDEEDVSIV